MAVTLMGCVQPSEAVVVAHKMAVAQRSKEGRGDTFGPSGLLVGIVALIPCDSKVKR